MNSNWEIAESLTAVGIFLVVTHACGSLANRFRQPYVTGEILGGLLLGPTLLGVLAPGLFASFFHSTPRIELGLNFIYQFGFMLLMFCSGLEIDPKIDPKHRKTVLSLGLAATFVTIIISYTFLLFFDFSNYVGTVQNQTTLKFILAIMAAVTSIPVISRIFVDLGILNTSFAKNILSIAVLDDLILYIALGVALSWQGSQSTQPDSSHVGYLNEWVKGLAPTTSLIALAVGQLLIVYGGVRIGRKLLRVIEAGPFRFLAEKSPTAFLLSLLITVTALGMKIGISPFLSAFASGIIASSLKKTREPSSIELKQFAYGFFIPIYFGVVGFRIDLIKDFSWVLMASLFFFLTFSKVIAVYVCSLFSNLNRIQNWQYALTLSAKGGPGIVIATVALDAGIINPTLSNTLIVISLFSSAIVGAFLSREKILGRIQ